MAYFSGSDPVEIDDLRSKIKVMVTSFPFFLHISLSNLLLWTNRLFTWTHKKDTQDFLVLFMFQGGAESVCCHRKILELLGLSVRHIPEKK